MGKLTTRQILDMIGNEIKWCEENGQKPELSENQKWFVLGLKQAMRLILHAEFTMELEDKDE